MTKRNNEIILIWSAVDSTHHATAADTNPVIGKIQSFSKLPANWHFGEGTQISGINVTAALDLVRFLEKNSIINIDAFPGTAGEIQVTAYPENGNFLEITIENPGSVDLILEDSQDNELLSHYGISMNEAKEIINTNKNLLFFQQNSAPSWSTRVSSVYITTTGTSKDSAVWLLNHPQTVESQLLDAVAQ